SRPNARRSCWPLRRSKRSSHSRADLPPDAPIRFVAVGDVMVDVLYAQLPPAGERVHDEVVIRAGGSAVNAAIAAAEAGAAPKLARLDTAAGANVILATADEARAVTGAAPEEAARALSSRFELAVVKLGEDGAIAARGDQIERAAAAPVERRWAFGAGDAFAG